VVEVHIVTDRETNVCKGYGFITFANKEQAGQAKAGEAGGGAQGCAPPAAAAAAAAAAMAVYFVT
jgi:hypothetical protein